MAAIKGRAKRPGNAPTVVLHARVAPAVRDKAHAAAAALGISVAAYIEQLVAHEQVDERGRPMWWPAHDTQEELTLPESA